MAVDPEALQRALRSQFPAPEVPPNSSDWMLELVGIFGSNPFVSRERDVLKLAEAPVSRLKAEPSEVRVAFVFEALNRIIDSQAFHFKIVLKTIAATLLRSGVDLNSLEAVRLVELVSKPNLPFPFKAILSAIDGVPRTPSPGHGPVSVAWLRHPLSRRARDEGDPRANRRSYRRAQGKTCCARRRVESNRFRGSRRI